MIDVYMETTQDCEREFLTQTTVDEIDGLVQAVQDYDVYIRAIGPDVLEFNRGYFDSELEGFVLSFDVIEGS